MRTQPLGSGARCPWLDFDAFPPGAELVCAESKGRWQASKPASTVPNSKHTPPASDEVEISLFGPGIGECSVVHLGGGQWMVVDSCIDRSTRRPVALEYLAEIGVD